MNVAIVGYALEGKSSCEYFLSQGHAVTICDSNEHIQDIPEGVSSRLGKNYLDEIDQFDLIVRTAGMNPSIISDHFESNAPPITTNINEFLRVCPTKNVIGITGTKGKGTTSTLTAKMLEASGKTVHLGGNIGVPALSFLNDIQPEDWVVLELSSFQLQDITHSPHIALCLMVVPEHLNWHQDLPDYTNAKANLFKHQTSNDIAIYFAENATSQSIASYSSGTILPYYQKPGAYIENDAIVIDGQTICKTSDIRLLGKHNWQNVCAAITAVWQAGVRDIDAIKSVITSFSGLEHRLEFVRTYKGVAYYDDSFGTTPETAIVAIQSFSEPKVVILGGSDKGANFDELAKAVTESGVSHVIAIGDMGQRITDALARHNYHAVSAGGSTMSSIVQAAAKKAQPGDIVLLSTGCASFGLFKDYKDRGNQFKQVVQSLA